MDAYSSSADPSQAFDSRYHDSFSMSNQQWETHNLPLVDTPQISFTQYTNFNASSEPTITSHILITSPKVSTISPNLKSGVWTYFDKVIIVGVMRAQCKLCPDVSYDFFKKCENWSTKQTN